jgi:hypothetical protein
MSCCDNPTVKARSMGDQESVKTYCSLANNADTNMFVSYKSGLVKEGYCSSCAGSTAPDYTQSGYGNLGSAYSQNQFPLPTGGKSCIGYVKY